MIWSRLKNFKCPKCNGQLSALLSCQNKKCDFTITKDRFDRLVADLYRPKGQRCATFEINQFELNNMGHEKVREDFSGSPQLDR